MRMRLYEPLMLSSRKVQALLAAHIPEERPAFSLEPTFECNFVVTRRASPETLKALVDALPLTRSAWQFRNKGRRALDRRSLRRGSLGGYLFCGGGAAGGGSGGGMASG
jgi:hypothetical protein